MLIDSIDNTIFLVNGIFTAGLILMISAKRDNRNTAYPYDSFSKSTPLNTL